MDLGGLEKYVLNIDQWHTPATDYTESKVGNFRIVRKKYTRGVYRYWGLDGYLVFKAKKAIPITTLQERRGRQWHDWMVDDPPQQRAMEIYAQHFKGRVLVAGLGLGLILRELAKNTKVTQVVVIEKSVEVIQLVAPYLSDLFKYEVDKPIFSIVCEDFYDFIKMDTNQWDAIFLDLWVTNEQTKERIFLVEVLPTAFELILQYPEIPLTFHGFQTISDVKPVGQDMVDLIVGMGGI